MSEVANSSRTRSWWWKRIRLPLVLVGIALMVIVAVGYGVSRIVNLVNLANLEDERGDQEWAKSGLVETVRSRATAELAAEIDKQIGAAASSKAGFIHLTLRLGYDTGRVSYLRERGYHANVFQGGSTHAFSIEEAMDTVVKMFVARYPDFHLVNVNRCSEVTSFTYSGKSSGEGIIYGEFGLDLVYEPRGPKP